MVKKADPLTLDVQAFIDHCVELRFPRLTADGEWEVEEEVAVSMDVRKISRDFSDKVQRKMLEFQVEYLGIGDLPEETNPVLDAMKAHGLDVLIACLNILAILKLPPVWMAVLACTTNIFVVFKNVGRLADYVFDFFDYLDQEINDAIDRLQRQLEQQALALIHPDVFGIAVALTITVAFDVSQTFVHVVTVMPWALQRWRNFFAFVATPCVAFCLLQSTLCFWFDKEGVADLTSPAPTEAASAPAAASNLTAPIEFIGLASAAGGAGYAKVGGAVVDRDQWYAIVTQIVQTLVMTAVRSWPVIRLVVNSLIRMAEVIVNHYVHESVKIDNLNEVCASYAVALQDLPRSCEANFGRRCSA